MQTNKHAFGRKQKERIKDKIKFMIHYKINQSCVMEIETFTHRSYKRTAYFYRFVSM
jgi:hypothetical protein